MIGKVVSMAMQKTAVVEINRRVRHDFYKKIITKTRRIKAHHELKNLKPGDNVRLVSTRPLSKTKHHKITEVLNATT